MRVLAMAHAYPPHHNAGAEMTMHALLRHLGARGHEVHVQLSRGMDGQLEDYELDGIGVHVHRDGNGPIPYFTSPPVDLVIAHLENTLRAAALCHLYRVPMVHLIHNTHDFTKAALRRGPCQLAVFNTEWMRADFALNWAGTRRGPMPPHVVIHPPVLAEDYAGKHGQAITLINLNADKGGQLFWRLAEAMPERQFLAVKGAYGGQVEPDEIPANVHVEPHVRHDEMYQVYGHTKVLLMPSIYESYGRTAIEAAHCGIPTIAHPTPGLKEALGSTGVFVNRADQAGWVAAIKYLSSPRGFSAASRDAKAHAQALDPQADLDRFADALEGVVRRGFALTR